MAIASLWPGAFSRNCIRQQLSSLFLVAPLTPYLGNLVAVASCVVHFCAHISHRCVFVWCLSGQNKQKDIQKILIFPVCHILRGTCDLEGENLASSLRCAFILYNPWVGP
jgi:hypothetical protein